MGRAGLRVEYLALCVVILVLLAIVLFPLLGSHRVYRVRTYIDINSGDVRTETTICSLPINDEIRVTQFSQEVRRLGVAIPKNPKWKPVVTRGLTGSDLGHTLSPVIGQCKLLMDIFVQENVPDEERLVVLKSILGSLEKGELAKHEIDDQLRALLARETKDRPYY